MALNQALEHVVSAISDVLPEAQREEASRALLKHLESQFSSEDFVGFAQTLEHHGEAWGFHPYHKVASEILTTMLHALTGPQPIHGIEHAANALEKVKNGERVVMVGNHLSYGDANYLQAQLAMQGLPQFPLLVMAGPKVYTDLFRRLSSMCFDTLKMAQPPSRASGGADVSMRELAEITRVVMKEADKYQGLGRILYFFPEGSRSRSGGMERFIPASARYCNHSGTTVYPIGFAGTDGLLGVDGQGIRLDDMQVSIGAGISVDEILPQLPSAPAAQRKAWMDVLGYAVAAQLPEGLRGIYDGRSDLEDLEDWRHLIS